MKERDLTAKELEAIYTIGVCRGNKSKAARQIGIDRKSLAERFDRALQKLGKRVVQQHITKSMPRDRRGQEHIAEDDDRRS